MTTLWDTTGTDVVRALSAERRAAGSVAAGLALTLVAVVEERDVPEAETAAAAAAAMHPCRLLLVVRHLADSAKPRLDAEVAVGGRLGPGEAVVMRMGGRLALHAESVVLPLLASDSPVVTWWFGAAPVRLAYDPLAVLAGRRVTDASMASDPISELQRRAEDYHPGDTDLAWTRTTPWRSLLAAAYDGITDPTTQGLVRAEAGNPSAVLLAGWLSARLGIDVPVETSAGPGITTVRLTTPAGLVTVSREDGRTATLCQPNRPDRVLPLVRRQRGDLLGEELHRLDADEAYAEALGAATGTTGLSSRDPGRLHLWREPTSPNQPVSGQQAAPVSESGESEVRREH